MLALALTSAWQRKRRLAGTVAAVVLGVAFLAATLVVGASARAGFRNTFVTANAGVDAYVRSSQQLTGGVENVRPPLPAATVAAVAGVDGVTAARPLVQGTALVAGPDGRPLDGGRPSVAAEAWVDVPELTGWRLAEGRAPGRTARWSWTGPWPGRRAWPWASRSPCWCPRRWRPPSSASPASATRTARPTPTWSPSRPPRPSGGCSGRGTSCPRWSWPGRAA